MIDFGRIQVHGRPKWHALSNVAVMHADLFSASSLLPLQYIGPAPFPDFVRVPLSAVSGRHARHWLYAERAEGDRARQSLRRDHQSCRLQPAEAHWLRERPVL